MTRKSILAGAVFFLLFTAVCPPLPGQVGRQRTRILRLSTPDQGYAVFPYVHFPGFGVTTVAVGTADAVRAVQVVLPFTLTVSDIQVYVSTAKGSSFYGCGIYSADGGTLLLETGAINTATTGLKKVTLSPSVTLEAGMYWYAWTSNSNSMRLQGANGTNNTDSLFIDTVDQMGHMSVSGVSGVLPAALGTAVWATFDIPYALMKP